MLALWYIYIFVALICLFILYLVLFYYALSRKKGRQRFVVYIGGRSMTYDVKFMYEMDIYLNNIYLDLEFVYLF